MGKVHSSLTVMFEEPFRIGVFERYEDGKAQKSCKKRAPQKQKNRRIMAALCTRYARVFKSFQKSLKKRKKVPKS
ncbi:MAG: hypothetical protein Q3985_06365 [Eubacteriales bacterium]|nr:hypothetical protein [Eubacteriales bacterium]